MRGANGRPGAIAAIAVGVLLRIASVPVSGTPDVDAWKTWSYHASVNGVSRMYGVGGSPPQHPLLAFGDLEPILTDYPPLALYEFGALGRVYAAVTGGPFVDGFALSIAIKLFILAFDVAIALAIYFAVGRALHDGVRCVRHLLASYALNPAIIVSAAFLGYADVLFVLPAIGAIAAATAGRPFAAGALMAAAVLTKPQAVFIVPAVALAIWNRAGPRPVRDVMLAAAGGAAVLAVVLAPIVAVGALPNMIDAIGIYVPRVILSIHCFNAWWIAGYLLDVGRAIRIHDASLWSALTIPVREVSIPSIVARGLPNPTPIAFILPLGVMAWGLWTTRRSGDLFLVAALAAFLVAAYAMLATDAHENHAFAVVPLLLVAAAGRPRFAPIATTISVTFALNLLFYGFRLTPERSIIPPRTMTVIDTTLIIAVINCAALAWFAMALTREAAPGREEPGQHDRLLPLVLVDQTLRLRLVPDQSAPRQLKDGRRHR